MKLARWVHALTDIALGFCFGGSIVAALAATSIFRVSREQAYDRGQANVLAGELFAWVGVPLLVAAGVVGLGCLFAGLHPPVQQLPGAFKRNLWRAMAALGVALALAVGFMEAVSNRRMHELRREGHWEQGKLVNAAEQSEFDGLHRRASAIYMFTIVSSALLLGARRVAT
ncbi:MAG: hypothetical protein HPKKFMNG_03114 [Planctomycetes bacterium]|nr:hypothetical protein [Planctomycetota bacterium]MCQ3951390.1 hypothetical protein [Planctomycetota bacterium]GIK54079.1 MAG: hypothetical protein BroJett014_30520 [Planctomycetota bacterium]